MYCENCGTKLSDHDAFCSKCGQPRSGGAAVKERRPGVFQYLWELLDDYSAQAWPILMVMLILMAVLTFISAYWFARLVGAVCIIYAVRELLRWYIAKKAGERYSPFMAKLGYIAFVVLAVALVIHFVLGPLSPVSRVKSMKFDIAPDYTVEQVINHSLTNPEWSSESGDDCTYVYVYGELDGNLVGFEFTLTSHGDYDYASLSDMAMNGTWMGEEMAVFTYMGLCGDM